MDWLKNKTDALYTIAPDLPQSCAITLWPDNSKGLWQLEFVGSPTVNEYEKETRFSLIVEKLRYPHVHATFKQVLEDKGGAASWTTRHGDETNVFRIFHGRGNNVVFQAKYSKITPARSLAVGFPYKILPIDLAMLLSDLYLALQQELERE
jgi:hypothetical protein